MARAGREAGVDASGMIAWNRDCAHPQPTPVRCGACAAHAGRGARVSAGGMRVLSRGSARAARRQSPNREARASFLGGHDLVAHSSGLGRGRSVRGTSWQGVAGKRRQGAGVEQGLRRGGTRVAPPPKALRVVLL